MVIVRFLFEFMIILSSRCICVPIHRLEPCRGFWHPPWEPLQLLVQIGETEREQLQCSGSIWKPEILQARHEDYERLWRGMKGLRITWFWTTKQGIVEYCQWVCQCCLRLFWIGPRFLPRVQNSQRILQVLAEPEVSNHWSSERAQMYHGSRNKAEPIQDHIAKHILWNIVGPFCEDLWSVITSSIVPW